METQEQEITHSDLVQVVIEAFGIHVDDIRPEGAMRSEEIAEVTDKSVDVIRRVLRKLIEQGEVECVRIPFKSINGVTSMVSAYRPIKEGDFTEGEDK